MVHSANEWINCPDCGTLQRVPRAGGWTVLFCRHCRGVLERTNLRSLDAALAVSASALVLFIPALTLPFLTTMVLGASRTSHLWSSSTAMFTDGWPDLALVILVFTVLAPLARYSLMTFVLGSLRFRRPSPHLGRAFRYANALETWAMLDVYLLGLAVAYERLRTSIYVQLDVGARCFIAVGILTLFLRATLDKAAIWERIASSAAHAKVAGAARAAQLSCTACELILPREAEGTPCPRCQKTLHFRRPEALRRAAALTLAGAILYLPANIYPMATLPIGFSSVKYTVLEGVIDLWQAQLIPLALLVLTASFAIPLLKLVGLLWCLASAHFGWIGHLKLKTRTFRVIEEIGRWSMIDPFVISCFVPVTHYNSLIYGKAEPAAPAFTAVVILTIIASKCFDPRLMWDAAERST